MEGIRSVCIPFLFCWSIFWLWYSSQSFWVGISMPHLNLAKIWPLFFAVLLQICQSVRASPVHSPIQLISQIFSGIQVWALAGPFQNFNLLLVRPDLDVDSDICCVSLFYWKIKFIIIACFLADAWRFCIKTEWYLELFIISSTLIKASALTCDRAWRHARSCLASWPVLLVSVQFWRNVHTWKCSNSSIVDDCLIPFRNKIPLMIL